MDECNFENLKRAVNDPELIDLFNNADTPTIIICILLLLDTDEQRQEHINFIQRRVKEMLEESNPKESEDKNNEM